MKISFFKFTLFVVVTVVCFFVCLETILGSVTSESTGSILRNYF